MYLLYVDESGSHGQIQRNRAYVLAGLAVHENDAAALQSKLSELVRSHVPGHAEADAHELHAAEIRNPRRRHSIWRDTDGNVRRRLLEEALTAIAQHTATRADRPLRAFAMTFDPATPDVQRVSFEALLHRFDAFLGDCADAGDPHNGIAIADETHLERQIQQWSQGWRETATALGQLEYLADVPLFANSKATRLLQAADLIAWSVWRAHGADPGDPAWLTRLGRLVEVTGPSNPALRR